MVAGTLLTLLLLAAGISLVGGGRLMIADGSDPSVDGNEAIGYLIYATLRLPSALPCLVAAVISLFSLAPVCIVVVEVR